MTSDDDQMDSVEMDGRGTLSDQPPVTDPAAARANCCVPHGRQSGYTLQSRAPR